MAVNAGCSPFVVNWTEADVGHCIPMHTVLGFLNDLTRAYIIDEGAPAFWTGDQIAETIGYFETNLHWSILVPTCVFTDRVLLAPDSEIPKLDGVVLTCCQEGIESFWISLRICSFVEFYCMDMLEMAIIQDLNWLILINIVNYHIFVWSTNDSNVTWYPWVMQSKCRNMLSCRMLKCLQDFVKTTLL